MKDKMREIPIHDIMPLMEVPDSSFTFLMMIVVLLLLLGIGVSYLLYRYMRERHRSNQREKYFKALSTIDFTQPKQAAYDITKYGRVFADDSERLSEAFQNLVERLEAYKYKKEVEKIDSESQSYYKIYLGMIDV